MDHYSHFAEPASINGLLFAITNSVTGFSYLIISFFVWMGRLTLVPPGYIHLFAAFIFWCGVHHLFHALLPFGLPYEFQNIADVIMTTISALTAILITLEISNRV